MNRRSPLLFPVVLFLIAVGVRLLTIAWIEFPPTEGSLYYLDVARNLVQGHGLTTDVLWSYASPPLTLPRPAFDLWLPLASVVAAIPMLVAGTSTTAGQLGGAIVGALLAPLAWAVATEAARLDGLDQRRTRALSITAGLLAAVLGPWLVATAAPDSAVPFTVLAVIASLLISRMLLRPTLPGWRAGLVLGIVLGVTYLARQEVVWLGLTFLVLCAGPLRRIRGGRPAPGVLGAAGPDRRSAACSSWGPGSSVSRPRSVDRPRPRRWRTCSCSATSRSSPSMIDRPSAPGWARASAPSWQPHFGRWAASSRTRSSWAAFPVGLLGILSVILLRRRPSLRRPSALVVLLLSGTLTFLASAVLFPVATLWGTFLHASGPLLMGCIVASVLGVDAGMARVSLKRRWAKVNVIVGPVALLALAIPVAIVQLASVSDSAVTMERRIEAVRFALRATADDPTPLLMSDHPMALAWVLDRPVMVLPDDPPTTLGELARDTGVRLLLVFDDVGRYPDALLVPSGPTCLAADPQQIGLAEDPAWLFRIDPACATP